MKIERNAHWSSLMAWSRVQIRKVPFTFHFMAKYMLPTFRVARWSG
jgi:hypothetical protein